MSPNRTAGKRTKRKVPEARGWSSELSIYLTSMRIGVQSQVTTQMQGRCGNPPVMEYCEGREFPDQELWVQLSDSASVYKVVSNRKQRLVRTLAST